MYIDLLQIQRFSFLKFLKNGINQVFDNINPIIIANRKYIFFSKYYLLKIPSQIDFISINNQFKPSEIVNKPYNSFSSHSIFDILSSNQSTITSSHPSKVWRTPNLGGVSVFPVGKNTKVSPLISHFTKQWGNTQKKFGLSYLNLNFYMPMSSVKYANWFKMRTHYLYKHNLKKPLKHYNKIGLFPDSKRFTLTAAMKEYPGSTNIFDSDESKQGSTYRFTPNQAMKEYPNLKNTAFNFFLKAASAEQNYTYLYEHDHPELKSKKNKWPVLKKAVNISSTKLNSPNLGQIQGTSHLTYSSEFYIPVQIIDQISKKMYLRWLLLADLPIQTKRGHFIINGYPKTVIHQIVRSPGIRFKNEDNQILADIISMRGAWMGIQIVYEKNVKAAVVGLKSQNKMINNSMLENSQTRLLNKNITLSLPLKWNDRQNLTSIGNFNSHENTEIVKNQNQNTKSNLLENSSFQASPLVSHLSARLKSTQPSRYQYQAFFLQNAIIKSEKINCLPSPRPNLLEAKYENKVLEKLKHWPKTFFNYRPMNFGNKSWGYLKKPKKLLIQQVLEEPIRKNNKNQFYSGFAWSETTNKAVGWNPTKHYFKHYPYWSVIRYY